MSPRTSPKLLRVFSRKSKDHVMRCHAQGTRLLWGVCIVTSEEWALVNIPKLVWASYWLWLRICRHLLFRWELLHAKLLHFRMSRAHSFSKKLVGSITEGVALSASQDQQNNSVKHSETVYVCFFTLNCMFALSGARQSLYECITRCSGYLG